MPGQDLGQSSQGFVAAARFARAAPSRTERTLRIKSREQNLERTWRIICNILPFTCLPRVFSVDKVLEVPLRGAKGKNYPSQYFCVRNLRLLTSDLCTVS